LRLRIAAVWKAALLPAASLSVAIASCRGSADQAQHSLHERTLGVIARTRPFDARFSDANLYSPCEPTPGERLVPLVSCQSRSDSTTLDLASSLSVEIARTLARAPTTDALWSAAVLDLWSAHGEPRTLDRVIGRLTEVSARDTSNAMVLNDLALAHLARGSARDDARDLFAAVDFAERAFFRDSSSRVIRFNRAVVLERARLDGSAILAWERVAAGGGDGWATEARGRSQRLAAAERSGRVSAASIDTAVRSGPASAIRSIVRRDPQTAREYVLDTVVRRWSRAALSADTEAAAGTARHSLLIGRELLALSGDSSVIHVSREMERGRPGSGAASSVAGALEEAADGVAAYRRGLYIDAEPRLRSAVQKLTRLGAPMLADWTNLLMGAVEVQRSRYALAESMFGGIADRARARQAIALEARAQWGLALSRARRGETSGTDRICDAAIAAFERLRETSNAGFVQALVADVHHALGRSSEHARAMYAALDAFHRRSDPAFTYPVLVALSQRLADDGVQWAAVAAIREAGAIAPRTHRLVDVPESLERLAYEEARLGNIDAAAKTIARVRAILSSANDSLMRARLDGEVARVEAVIYRRTDPKRARERLDVVTRYFAAMRIPTDVGPALIGRADVRLVLGDSAGAMADLDSATTVVATLASGHADRATVRQLVATQSDVYRRLVAIALARGDTMRAFRYTELSRADTVVARQDGGRGAWPAAKGDVTLSYLLLDDRMLIWVLHPGVPKPFVFSVRTTPGEVDALTTRFVNLIRQDADSAAEREVARRLYDLFVRPVEGRLGDVRRLVLVLDRGIADVPFAAVRDERGQYLIERFALAYAQRAATSHVVRPVALSGSTRVLLVGNPSWDRNLFPGLDALRSADAEIAAIRALRKPSMTMTGAAATRDAFLRELPRQGIVHFAGHAQVVREEPMRSYLVMARDSSGFAHNVVFASDIVRLDLRAVRLAILSACGEARDRYAAGPARNGLVQALLDAGVAEVIASQWEADDRGTADLMVALHSELTPGVPGDEALRRAQVAMAKLRSTSAGSSNGTRVWGAFRFYVN
jgi:CHAT domain-containing protein